MAASIHEEHGGSRLDCVWGASGLRARAAWADLVVIVDVLSFCTAVDVAVSRGGSVIPCLPADPAAPEIADRQGAELAGRRGEGRFSLSPACYLDLAAGTRVVLPSPNGAATTLAAQGCTVLAGCLRNAPAVAAAAARAGRRILVVACGERWPDGSLRPALEDLLGAGAILSRLHGARSGDAAAAVAAFRATADLRRTILDAPSGRELADLGYTADVDLASEFDVSNAVPRFDGMAYGNAAQREARRLPPAVRVVPWEARWHAQGEALIAGLRDWFGLLEANAKFLADLERLPSWAAVDAEGAVVGAVTLGESPGGNFELMFLAVRRDLHRGGVGRALVERVVDEARGRGGAVLHVKTLAPSHPDPGFAKTRAFYLATGFTPVFETDALWGPTNPALILVRALR